MSGGPTREGCSSNWNHAVRGQPEALVAMIRSAFPRLHRRAVRLIGASGRNGLSADDLVQDTCERALRYAGRPIDCEEFERWALRVMRNLFLDHCRKIARAEHLSIDARMTERIPLADPETLPAWSHLTWDDLRNAHGRLPPALARTAYKVHFEGLSHEQVAREEGLPKSTVGTRLLRARRRLENLLKEELATPGNLAPPDPSLGELASLPCFDGEEAATLHVIRELARPSSFHAGQVVCRQGEPGVGMFIVCAGFMKETVSTANGGVSCMAMLGPGETLGELALLDGGPCAATVSAVTRVKVLALERASFLELVRTQPTAAVTLMEVVARRLRRSSQWASQSADDSPSMSVGGRIARELLRLARPSGARGEVAIPYRLSQKELGLLVGATRESVNKYLRQWRDQKLIAERDGVLVITDSERLQAQEFQTA